jgi:hypothetical protein
MLVTNQLSNNLYEAKDESRSIFFWLNADNSWTVNLRDQNRRAMLIEDSFDDAQGVAYKYLEVFPV